MAIAGNSSSVETQKVFNLYTGVGKAKVLVINPKLEELNNLGFNFTNEPEYLTTDENGVQKLKLQFFVQNPDKEDLKTNITLFLENKDRMNNAGDKYEIINNLGQTTWGAFTVTEGGNTENYKKEAVSNAINRTNAKGEKWFSENGVRVAKVGEVALTNFLSNWCNITSGNDVYLDDINSLITKGNVKELRDILADPKYKDNTFKALYKVRDTGEKQYQTVDSNIFDRGFKRDDDYKVFSNYATKQTSAGYDIKDIWTYEFQIYNPKPVSPDTANSSYEATTNAPKDDLAF